MQAGDLATACDRFAESEALEPTAGALLNLAVCEEKSGKLIAAQKHYQSLLATLPATDDRRTFVEKAIQTLTERLPVLRIKLAAGWPEDSELTVDGAKAEMVGREAWVPVDMGTHLIAVNSKSAHAFRSVRVEAAPSAEPQRIEISTAGPAPSPESGARRAVAGSEPRSTAATPPGANPPPLAQTGSHTARSSPGAVAYGAAGVTIAAIATAAVAGLDVIREKEIVSAKCPNRICDGDGLAAAQAGKQSVVIANVAGAIAMLGASIAIWEFATAGQARSVSIRVHLDHPALNFGYQF